MRHETKNIVKKAVKLLLKQTKGQFFIIGIFFDLMLTKKDNRFKIKYNENS